MLKAGLVPPCSRMRGHWPCSRPPLVTFHIPAPGLLASRSRRSLNPPSPFFANPRSHAPRSGETNHKPPKFHKENFWALRPLLLFDKLSCSIYCKLQIANTKLLMKSGQPIKKFHSTNKQNEPT